MRREEREEREDGGVTWQRGLLDRVVFREEALEKKKSRGLGKKA